MLLFRLLFSRVVLLLLVVAVVGAVGYGKRAQLEELYDRVRAGEPAASSSELKPDADGVLFSASAPGVGGWYVAVLQNGRVVHVADTSGRATPDDYRTWVATPHGRERLLAEVQRAIEHPRRSRGGPSVMYAQGALVAGIDDALAAVLRNPRWLGDDLASPPRPWVPAHLTVLARRVPGGATVPAKRWPYPAGIAQRNDGKAPHDRTRTLVCLDGAEVAPLFQKLRGVDAQNMGVDDGQRWNLSVQPAYPGYRQVGDPCPRV